MTKPFEHLTAAGPEPSEGQAWIDSKKIEAAISATKSVEQRVLDSLQRIEGLLGALLEYHRVNPGIIEKHERAKQRR